MKLAGGVTAFLTRWESTRMKHVIVKSGCIMLLRMGLDSQPNEGGSVSASMQNNSGCVGEMPGRR